MYLGCKGEGTLEKVFEIGLPQNGFAMLWIKCNLALPIFAFRVLTNFVLLRCRQSMESSKLAGWND